MVAIVAYIIGFLFAGKIVWNICIPYVAYCYSRRYASDRGISMNPAVDVFLFLAFVIVGGLSGVAIGPVRGWGSLLGISSGAMILSYVHLAVAMRVLSRRSQRKNKYTGTGRSNIDGR
jgi:hypothetical protein